MVGIVLATGGIWAFRFGFTIGGCLCCCCCSVVVDESFLSFLIIGTFVAPSLNFLYPHPSNFPSFSWLGGLNWSPSPFLLPSVKYPTIYNIYSFRPKHNYYEFSLSISYPFLRLLALALSIFLIFFELSLKMYRNPIIFWTESTLIINTRFRYTSSCRGLKFIFFGLTEILKSWKHVSRNRTIEL